MQELGNIVKLPALTLHAWRCF